MRTAAAEREARARALLAGEGLAATIRSAGPDDEIAAVAAPLSSMAAVRALAPSLRALGYRYVTLDLTAAEDRNRGRK